MLLYSLFLLYSRKRVNERFVLTLRTITVDYYKKPRNETGDSDAASDNCNEFKISKDEDGGNGADLDSEEECRDESADGDKQADDDDRVRCQGLMMRL